MIRSKSCFFHGACALLSGVLCAGDASGAYIEVFSEAELNASAFLDTVVTSGGTAYAVTREFNPTAIAGQVTSFDGSTFSQVMSVAQWQAAGPTGNPGAANGAVVNTTGSGQQLRFVNTFTNSLWQVALDTGAVTEVVPASTVDAAVGGSANLTASSLVTANGSAFAYDGFSDSVIRFSSAGTVSTAISSAQLTTLTGSDSLSNSGFEVIGSELYFGSNTGDSLYKWDFIGGVGSVVLDTAQLEALSDDIDGSAGVDDIFLAPDGLVYFYEDDADYIYSFSPADPVGTLEVVLTEAQLNAGPAGSDLVGQFAWWNGNIAWTRVGQGFYAIPEPGTAVLGLMAASLGFARRR